MWVRIQLLLLVFALLLPLDLFAQHERQYSQFMFNKMVINPAYAGTYDGVSATLFYRKQWIGLEGAPTTMGANVDASLRRDKIGLGLNIIRNTVSIFDTWTMDGIYSYKMRVGQSSILSAGLQTSLRYFGANFQDPRLRSSQGLENDPAIPSEEVGSYLWNFGFGLYFTSKRFFAGISMPRLLNTNLDFVDRDVPLSRESRHAFAMAGAVMPISEAFEWVPQVLIKQSQGAPISVDVNTGFVYQKRLTLGLTYRTGGLTTEWGESIDVIFGAQITRALFLGTSYDILLTSLRNHSSGSAEIVLRYAFSGEKAGESPVRVINPRYF
jgi:type IX secretion system PorP/SprF family membrane protein